MRRPSRRNRVYSGTLIVVGCGRQPLPALSVDGVQLHLESKVCPRATSKNIGTCRITAGGGERGARSEEVGCFGV